MVADDDTVVIAVVDVEWTARRLAILAVRTPITSAEVCPFPRRRRLIPSRLLHDLVGRGAHVRLGRSVGLLGREPSSPLRRTMRPESVTSSTAGQGWAPSRTLTPSPPQRMVRAGTTIAWGITPTTGEGGTAAAQRRLDGVFDQLSAMRMDPIELMESSVLTASCGTGARAAHEERAVSSTLREIARRGRRSPR